MLHFLDSDLAAWLLGIRDADTLTTYPLRGDLFETHVASQQLRRCSYADPVSVLYFRRDNVGHEMDVLLEFFIYFTRLPYRW